MKKNIKIKRHKKEKAKLLKNNNIITECSRKETTKKTIKDNCVICEITLIQKSIEISKNFINILQELDKSDK
jgi:hypothetical protein